MALGEVATRDFLRGELRDLLDEIDERASAPPASAVPADPDLPSPARPCPGRSSATPSMPTTSA